VYAEVVSVQRTAHHRSDNLIDVSAAFEDATSPTPRARSVDELAELLTDPTGETPSPASGDPIVVVELDGDLTDGATALRDRPCVSVGVHRGGTGLPTGVNDFDVLVTSTSAPSRPWTHDDGGLVDRIGATAAANPRASVALVQLLRLCEELRVADALVAESAVYSMLLAGPEFRRWLDSRPATRRAPDGDPVRVERAGSRLSISLSRPEVHNAYSAAMRDALASALAIAVTDPGIDEVLLRGDGPSFCSGGDLQEFGTAPDPATAHLIRVTRSPARLLAELTDRVVVDVHGACIGAGVELAAFARRIVSSESTWFALPEVGMGLVPGAGGTVSVPRRIGRHRAAALALSGDRLDAEQALTWGLVDEIGPRQGTHPDPR
jgi:enoyl-CoA hydratase/carnithine racemase